MGALYIGVEELQPQKDIIKVTLIGQVKKLIAVVQLKKSWEKVNTGISSKYLFNTQLLITEW